MQLESGQEQRISATTISTTAAKPLQAQTLSVIAIGSGDYPDRTIGRPTTKTVRTPGSARITFRPPSGK